MQKGILKKHRNELFEILKASGLDLKYFDSEYQQEKNEFKIYVKGHDFKFKIVRNDDSFEDFDTIEGDGINDENGIDDIGTFDNVVESFKEWLNNSACEFINIVRDENILPDYWEIIKDPVTKKYQEEFFDEFEIIDENSETEPFNLQQQLFLDSYLDKVIKDIDKFKTNENTLLITQIKNDSRQLKDEIPRITKKETIKKLSTIWAKMRKAGLNIIKELFIAVKQEIIKAIIKGTLGLP